MNKTEEKNVKIVPENDVKQVALASIELREESSIKLKLYEENKFELCQLFEIIAEENNSIEIFKANLTKKDKDIYSFAMATESRLIKKREYERSNIKLEVKDNKKFSATTINISAGGMKLKSEKALKEKKSYKLTVLFEDKEILLSFQALRVEKELNYFIISGRFTEISSTDKAFIIQQNLKKKLDIRYNNSKGEEE